MSKAATRVISSARFAGGSGMIADAVRANVSKDCKRSREEVIAAHQSENRLKKDGANQEPKTCPTCMIRKVLNT